KSVLSKNMLVPLLPGAKRISIEDLNDPGGRADATITASMFPSLAAELNAFDEDKHFVLDIGASSAKEMVGHFARLATTRSDIAADETDYRDKMRRQKAGHASAQDIGRRIVVRDMARDACVHLRSVFDAAVMGQVSADVRPL